MDDYQPGTPPHEYGTAFTVKLKDGTIRTVKREDRYSSLLFTDCVHPAQNIICDDDSVEGWKRETKATK